MSYVWRNLLRRKVRTTLSMMGVAVSVAAIVSLISVADGMLVSLDSYMAASGAELTVFTRNVADLIFSRVSESDIEKIQALEGVEDVARANFTMVMSPRLGEGHGNVPMIICFGRLPEERIMEKYRQFLVEGRLPRELDEVIVGSFLAANLGVQVGDRMPLFGTPILGISEYRVTGIYNSDINWENGGLVVNARILQERLDAGESYILVFVYTSRADAERVQARIEEILPDLVAVPAGQITKEFSQQLEILDDFVLLVTIIALVVGVLGVLNTMMMSVSERTREIGMLRAVGWTRRRVLAVILAEGVLLSLVGAAVGVALGVAGTELLIQMMPDALLTAAYSVATLGKGVLVGLGVGLLATAYPALRASRLRPVEALRYE